MKITKENFPKQPFIVKYQDGSIYRFWFNGRDVSYKVIAGRNVTTGIYTESINIIVGALSGNEWTRMDTQFDTYKANLLKE